MSSRSLLPDHQAESLLLSAVAERSASGIVSRTLLQTPELRVVLFSLAEGQELTMHTSPRRALVQIVEGSCSFLFSGQWQRLAGGTLLHLPPGHPHAVRADEGPLVFLLTLGAEPSS